MLLSQHLLPSSGDEGEIAGKTLGPSQVGSTVSHDLSQHVYVLASFRSSSWVPMELLLIPSPIFLSLTLPFLLSEAGQVCPGHCCTLSMGLGTELKSGWTNI